MRDLPDAVMRFFTWELWGLLLMEHQPEWACECESCAVTQGSLWEENGPLLSKAFSCLLTFSIFLVLLPSNFVSHGFLHLCPPPNTLLWHYLVSFLSMWLAACQHPIIAYTFFLSLPPPARSLYWVLIPNQPVLYMSVRQWPYCMFFFSSLF